MVAMAMDHVEKMINALAIIEWMVNRPGHLPTAQEEHAPSEYIFISLLFFVVKSNYFSGIKLGLDPL